jgi:hypothetical protein
LGRDPEHIYCRDGHVQVKVQLLLATCLAVGKTGVLFCVSNQKFNLMAQPVVPDDLFGMLAPIG